MQPIVPLVSLVPNLQLGNVLVPEAHAPFFQLIPTLYMGTSRNCAAPTGLKKPETLLTHRLRSGLRLLYPDGVSISNLMPR